MSAAITNREVLLPVEVQMKVIYALQIMLIRIGKVSQWYANQQNLPIHQCVGWRNANYVVNG